MPHTSAQRPILAYVSVWAGLALLSLGLALAIDSSASSRPSPPDWVVVAVAIALFAANTSQVRVRANSLDSADDATTLVDVVLIPLMVAFPVDVALSVTVVATGASEALSRDRTPMKAIFNVSWMTVAVAVGSWVAGHVLGAQSGWRSVVAATAAAVVFVAVNVVAFSGVVALVASRPWRQTFRREWAYVRDVGFAMGGTGALAAVLTLELPSALPLLAAFLLPARNRAAQRQRIAMVAANERKRLQRTVAGASDGIALLDAQGTVEVWNPAMTAMTGVEEVAARGRPVSLVAPAALAEVVESLSGPGGEQAREIDLDGRAIDVRTAPVTDEMGRRTGTVLSLRDRTDERVLAGLQQDLISRVSHELRTPLTTVVGFLETLDLRWDNFPEPLRREQIAVALRASRRLQRLVGDLLLRSGIEHGTSTPRPVPVAVDTLVADLLQELGDLLPDGVHHRRVPGLKVTADADHLHQMLGNLLANAATYGASPIEVDYETVGGIVEIRITDHGAGVPEDFLPKLFDPFTQASTGVQRTARGLGIGLSVVRGLAQANGGDLQYRPTPGGGATFLVTLPRSGMASD